MIGDTNQSAKYQRRGTGDSAEVSRVLHLLVLVAKETDIDTQADHQHRDTQQQEGQHADSPLVRFTQLPQSPYCQPSRHTGTFRSREHSESLDWSTDREGNGSSRRILKIDKSLLNRCKLLFTSVIDGAPQKTTTYGLATNGAYDALMQLCSIRVVRSLHEIYSLFMQNFATKEVV